MASWSGCALDMEILEKRIHKIIARISDVADFRRIAADALRGDTEVTVSGLSGSARALFVAGLWQSLRRSLIVVLLTLCAATNMSLSPAAAAPAAPVQKVIVDTDIGDDIDDAFALELLTSLPEVQLLGVTTTYGDTGKRAELAAKLLQVLGRRDVPVHAGRAYTGKMGRQYEWARGFRSAERVRRQ